MVHKDSFSDFMLQADRRYAELFHAPHHLWFAVEYILFPTALFFLVFLMIRKENRSSNYLGIGWAIEVMARNWGELSLTFLLSWLLFELRIAIESNEANHQYFFSGNETFVTPYHLSVITFFGLAIFFVGYYFWAKKTAERGKKRPEVNLSIMMALLPITLYVQLIILALFYYLPVIRVASLLIMIPLGFVYFTRVYKTPYLYWNLVDEQPQGLEGQLQAIGLLLSAYKKQTFQKDMERKIDNLMDAKNRCIDIAEDFGVGRSKKEFLKQLVDTEKCLAEATTYMSKNKVDMFDQRLTAAADALKGIS